MADLKDVVKEFLQAREKFINTQDNSAASRDKKDQENVKGEKKAFEKTKKKVISKIEEVCPTLIPNLRLAVENFFTDPTNGAVVAALKQELLTAVQLFAAAYPNTKPPGADDIAQSFTLILRRVVQLIAEDKQAAPKLKIFHLPLLWKIAQQVRSAVDTTTGIAQKEGFSVCIRLLTLRDCMADVFPLSPYAQRIKAQLNEDVKILSSGYSFTICSLEEQAKIKSLSFREFRVGPDSKGGLVYTVCDAQKRVYACQAISKEELIDQLGLGSDQYQQFNSDLVRGEAKKLEPFFDGILKIATERGHSRTLLARNARSALVDLEEEIQSFFENRLFCSEEETSSLIRKIKQINQKLGLSLDTQCIRYARREFRLQKAIHAIEEHAKSYQATYPQDAQKATLLAQDMSQWAHDFFAAGEFTRDKRQDFLKKLSRRIHKDQQALAEHRGWSEVMENFALVVSSFLVIGLLPALFKFYMRTAGGDKYFCYFKTETAKLVDNVLDITRHIEDTTPSAPRLSSSKDENK